MTPPDNGSPRPTPSQQGDTSRAGQRFGRITGRRAFGSGSGQRQGTYYVSDDETGMAYSFSYADIVTEGFRTIRTGECVRFLVDLSGPTRADTSSGLISRTSKPSTNSGRTGTSTRQFLAIDACAHERMAIFTAPAAGAALSRVQIAAVLRRGGRPSSRITALWPLAPYGADRTI